MRALLAGIFVFVMLLLASSFIGSHSKGNDMPWWGVPFILVALMGSIAVALTLFNWQRKRPSQSGEEYLSELQEKGLLVSCKLEARRAFEVEEVEDEGSHFFVELTDGSVLFLTGQYLYDYRGIAKNEGDGNASFPCSEFTILRHKETNHVVDIICAGRGLPIECEAPPFNKEDFQNECVPEDGQVIRDRSYDEIKKERLKAKRS
jgi:hypothetical protein